MAAVRATVAGSPQRRGSGWTYVQVAGMRSGRERDGGATAEMAAVLTTGQAARRFAAPTGRSSESRACRAGKREGRSSHSVEGGRLRGSGRREGADEKERDGEATAQVAVVAATVAGSRQTRSSDRAFELCTSLRSWQERGVVERWRGWQPSSRLWQAARVNAAPTGSSSESRACGVGKGEEWWSDGGDGSRPRDSGGAPAYSQRRPDVRPGRVHEELAREREGGLMA